MITRNDDRSLTIPLEDTPYLAGIMAGFQSELQKHIADGSIPGSFMGAFRQMDDFAARLLEVMDRPQDDIDKV